MKVETIELSVGFRHFYRFITDYIDMCLWIQSTSSNKTI